MNIRMLSLIGAMLLSAGASFADEASKLEKAAEYLRLIRADRNAEQSVELYLQSFREGFSGQLAKTAMPPEARALVEDFMDEVEQITQDSMSWKALREEMERLAADTFTEQELDGMLAFVKSPAGQAMIEKTPIMMEGGAAIGKKRAQSMEPEIARLGLELSNKLQALARRQADQPKQQEQDLPNPNPLPRNELK